MKVVFEGIFQGHWQEDTTVCLHIDMATPMPKLLKMNNKYVRVTIEEIKEPAKETPKVCYAGMPV